MAKKIPMRRCISCNEKKDKKSLIRIVNNKELGIVIDDSGKINGRGAYLCKDSKCIKDAEKRKLLNRALLSNIDSDIYKEISNHVD